MSTLNSCNSSGVTEKYATSEPEINAEHSNRKINKTTETVMFNGEANATIKNEKVKAAGRGGSVSNNAVVRTH